jgi:hypothetical protein
MKVKISLSLGISICRADVRGRRRIHRIFYWVTVAW